jgi:two-component system sensor histidine kinase CssS
MNLEKTVGIIINGEMTLVGDLESWVRVIENLLSNNLRYAKTLITVELGDTINIKNDGPQIEEHLLSKIKKPFVKGKSGRSGLGLTIVNNILKLYHFELEIKNNDYGVEYIIQKEV